MQDDAVQDEGDEPDTSGGTRRWGPRRVLTVLLLTPLLLGFLGFGYLWASTDVPAPESVRSPQVSVVRYADGGVIARTGVENRTSVDLDQVSEQARLAVLAAEDRDFYEQPGISPTGILRAMWVNLRSGEVEQGGSTITQQYARNAFLSQERTLGRKLREAVIAVKLDRSRSKDELLERYLNTVYFGRGAYGIEAASRTYFGAPAAELDAAQGAVLAALLRSPSGYDPAEHPERARERWDYVLDGMREEGWLDAPAGSLEYPQVRPPQTGNDLAGPEGYLVEQALEELSELGYSPDDVDVQGLSIVTTIDRTMQAAAADALQEVTGEQPPDGVFRAVVSVEPGTGRIRASYGGTDYVTRPFNAVTQGRAQAGSSFKPYVLAAALKNGISLRTRFDGSSPQRFSDYEVKNFGRGNGAQYGEIDLVTATRNSVNTVFVPLGLEVGTREVTRTARALGITTDMREESRFPSVSLGVTAVTPLEQANAYATLAAGGVRAEPFIVERIEDRTGEVVYEAAPVTERAVSEEVAADVTHALRQVVDGGTGRAAKLPARPAAGKTGTTTGNTAAWFVGYTPRLATAVALFTDGSDQALPPLAGVEEVTGGSLPARIWAAYTRVALEGQPAEGFPEPAFTGERLSPPSPSPSPSREPRSEPSPEVERTPSQEPAPASTPAPQPSPEPSRDPEPTREPERSPKPSPEPEPSPPPAEPEPSPPPADPEPSPPADPEPSPPPADPEPSPTVLPAPPR